MLLNKRFSRKPLFVYIGSVQRFRWGTVPVQTKLIVHGSIGSKLFIT